MNGHCAFPQAQFQAVQSPGWLCRTLGNLGDLGDEGEHLCVECWGGGGGGECLPTLAHIQQMASFTTY